MLDHFPLRGVLRKTAIVILVISAIALAIGGIVAVIRGTGMTDTQVKAGFCLALLIASCVTTIEATHRPTFKRLNWGFIGQFILTLLYVLLGRFDKWFLSWLVIVPALFAIALIIMANEVYQQTERRVGTTNRRDSDDHLGSDSPSRL